MVYEKASHSEAASHSNEGEVCEQNPFNAVPLVDLLSQPEDVCDKALSSACNLACEQSPAAELESSSHSYSTRTQQVEDTTVVHATIGERPVKTREMPDGNLDDTVARQMQEHVDGLLECYMHRNDCYTYLLKLPRFVKDATMTFDTAIERVEKEILDLLEDQVNAHAAFHVQQCLADTMNYRLHVLLMAACKALSWTPEFAVDAVYSLLGSLLHKSLILKMGKYENKTRHWTNGVAESGQSKSPTMKPFVQMVEAVLSKWPSLAAGTEDDMFHMCQSFHCRITG